MLTGRAISLRPRRSRYHRRPPAPLSPLAKGTPYAAAFWRALDELPPGARANVSPSGTISATLPNGGLVSYLGRYRIADRAALEMLP